MLNNVIVMGRLTHDPEVRYTKSNVPVVSFNIACQRDYGSDGQPKTDFIKCEAWRSTAEFVGKYFSVGSMIVVTGRIQNDEWEDENGNRRVTTKVNADRVYFGESKRGEAKPHNISAADFEDLDNEDDGTFPF